MFTDAQSALIQAATSSIDPLSHWQRYSDLQADGMNNDGETRLFPIVHHNIRNCTSDIPKLDMLKSATRWAQIRRALAMRSVKVLESLCSDLNAPFILTKGIALADRVYTAADYRVGIDIDVIMHWPDMMKVREHVKSKGWKVNVDIHGTGSPDTRLTSTEFSFVLPGLAEIDISWSPRMPFGYDPTLADWLWSERTTEGIMSYPSRTWLLIEAIEHGVSNNVVSPIRWVVDGLKIVDDTNNSIDWHQFLQLEGRYRLTQTMLFGLETIAGFGGNVPTDVLSKLKASAIDPNEVAELEQRLSQPDLMGNYLNFRASNLLIRADDRSFLTLAGLFMKTIPEKTDLHECLARRLSEIRASEGRT